MIFFPNRLPLPHKELYRPLTQVYLEAGDGCVEEAEAGVEDEHEQKEEDRDINRDSYPPVLLEGTHSTFKIS